MLLIHGREKYTFQKTENVAYCSWIQLSVVHSHVHLSGSVTLYDHLMIRLLVSFAASSQETNLNMVNYVRDVGPEAIWFLCSILTRDSLQLNFISLWYKRQRNAWITLQHDMRTKAAFLQTQVHIKHR